MIYIMSLHESDSDIETKFTELREREQTLEKELRQIRKYQTNINSLKMAVTSEMQDVIVDEKTTKQKMIVYSLPYDFTGNRMTENARISQKIDLIKNINKFLGEDDE